MKTIRLLILEDDLKTLSIITDGLFYLEESLFEKHINFAITVYSEYLSVKDYLNQIENPNFDIILLDRDCKLSGSFHVIDVEKFGANKFIAISTQPEYNQDAKKMGVSRVVRKNYEHLDEFRVSLINEIKSLLHEQSK